MDEIIPEEIRKKLIEVTNSAIDCWKGMLDTIKNERNNELSLMRTINMLTAMEKAFECMHDLQTESLGLMTRTLNNGDGIFIPIPPFSSEETLEKIKVAAQQIIKSSDTRVLQ